MTITLRSENSGLRPEFDHVTTATRRQVRGNDSARAIRFRSIAPCSIATVPTSEPFDVRRWRLVWSGAQYGQWRQLRDFWDETLGGVIPMTYTPVGDIDANAVQVTFVPDSFQWERNHLTTYTMAVEIEELRGW